MWLVERRTQTRTRLEPYSWSRRRELSRAAGQGGMLPRCLGRDVERCRSPSPSSAPARDRFQPCVGLPSALDLCVLTAMLVLAGGKRRAVDKGGTIARWRHPHMCRCISARFGQYWANSLTPV